MAWAMSARRSCLGRVAVPDCLSGRGRCLRKARGRCAAAPSASPRCRSGRTIVSSSTVNSPVGCSTDTDLCAPGGSCARGNATVPAMTHAVATETAPSTPMASWQTCGMNVRVATVPPSRGAAISVILGTTRRATSPRFISGPAASRIASRFALSSAVRVEFRRRFVAGSAEITRRDDDHGHPVVDAGDRDPCDDVLRMPGREHRAATAAFGADEREQDRRRRPRHAADARVAV